MEILNCGIKSTFLTQANLHSIMTVKTNEHNDVWFKPHDKELFLSAWEDNDDTFIEEDGDLLGSYYAMVNEERLPLCYLD